MVFRKSIVSVFLTCILASSAFAAQVPKFNKDRKMKANEVMKKCAEWASKETASMKASTPAEKRTKVKKYNKLLNECTLANGFDSRGK